MIMRRVRAVRSWLGDRFTIRKGGLIHRDSRRQRPTWTDYFLGMAFLASQRSHDVHTQHGCIIVDENRHIVATGYNGFPKGMDDTSLPLTRPEKYLWMDHAEANAVANATRSLGDFARLTAYVTGKPCYDCLKTLRRHGVRSVVYANRRGFTSGMAEDVRAAWDRLVEQGDMTIVCVEHILGWMFTDEFKKECGV